MTALCWFGILLILFILFIANILGRPPETLVGSQWGLAPQRVAEVALEQPGLGVLGTAGHRRGQQWQLLWVLPGGTGHTWDMLL